MPKIVKTIAIVMAAALATVITMIMALSLWLQTHSAQQMLLGKGIELLQEKLQTKVSADSISVEVLKGQVRLYGLGINDREDSLLLHVKELHAGIAPSELFDHRVRITDAEIINADARLWKDSLSSNFQFIIDAFRKKSDTPINTPKQKMELTLDVKRVNVQMLHVKWDVRHKPRKNLVNPKRGAFDANHVDAMLNLNACVTQPRRDTYDISIDDVKFYDRAGGLQVNQLKLKTLVDKEKVKVSDFMLKMQNTRVKMDSFTIDLKKKEIPTPFALAADVMLEDISKPFSPVLFYFRTPLQLTTHVSGPLHALNLNDITIQTPDKRLTLTARGCMDGLFGRKEMLNLQFRDIDLRATHNMKEQLVMHFAKTMRLKMLRQMRAVGDIRFEGSLDVLYRKEVIAGKLSTQYGNINTRFTLDDNTKYMTGYLTTQSVEMGKLMNIPKLGPVKCRIDFDLNISRKSPRPATALPDGRLPMGRIRAKVYDANYDMLTVPEVNLDVYSDGSTASGQLWLPGMDKNMAIDVKYVQTDDRQDVWFRFSHNAQQWILKESIALLREKMNADVDADSINVNYFGGEASLYGLRIKDRQNHTMFRLDTLHTTFNTQQLLRNIIHVTHVGLHGVQVQLSKDSLGSNFSHLIQSVSNLSQASGKRKTDKKKKHRLDLQVNLEEVAICDMRLKWDVVDKPVKNVGNMKRGRFDANHIDADISLQAAFKNIAPDTYAIDLKQMSLRDNVSGLTLNDIHAQALIGKDRFHLDNLCIKMPHSSFTTDLLNVDLKKQHLLSPLVLKAHVVLQDIAQPFAPALCHFSTPLDLEATIRGGLDSLIIDNVMVSTPNGAVNLLAYGALCGMTGKHQDMTFAFRDVDLHADNATLLQLVMHFAKTVRLKLLRQLETIGDIRFLGNVELLHKQENIQGTLNTDYGNLLTDFTLNENTHFMTGYVQSPALELGKLLNIKHLKPIDAHIDFNFNTSSKAPRPATALPNGRLPQGQIQALIHNPRYGIFHTRTIETTITSDGSTATGQLRIPKILADLIIHFTYTQTDEEQHLKVRPKYKFHNIFRRKKSKKSFNPQKIYTSYRGKR